MQGQRPFFTLSQLSAALEWSLARTEDAINNLMQTGLVWIDQPNANEPPIYWVPAVGMEAGTDAYLRSLSS